MLLLRKLPSSYLATGAVVLAMLALIDIARELKGSFIAVVPPSITAVQKTIQMTGRTEDLWDFAFACGIGICAGAGFFACCFLLLGTIAIVLGISASGVSILEITDIAEMASSIAAALAIYNIASFVFECEDGVDIFSHYPRTQRNMTVIPVSEEAHHNQEDIQ